MRALYRLVLVAAALCGAAGCKQGLGDRCQIDDDCESGLVCSTGTNRVCTNSGTVIIVDAPPPSDARIDGGGSLFPDAPAPDAAAAPDAPPPDAPLGPDAM